MSVSKNLPVIGSTEFVDVFGVSGVPAKIDTGADSSAIWASDIDMKEDGMLVFSLFGKKSPFYTGKKIETRAYTASLVKSSIGKKQVRYRVKIPISIQNKSYETVFTLANRSRNKYPVLIGRHALAGNFVVDVSKSALPRKNVLGKGRLNNALRTDPYKFHQKYIRKGEKS